MSSQTYMCTPTHRCTHTQTHTHIPRSSCSCSRVCRQACPSPWRRSPRPARSRSQSNRSASSASSDPRPVCTRYWRSAVHAWPQHTQTHTQKYTGEHETQKRIQIYRKTHTRRHKHTTHKNTQGKQTQRKRVKQWRKFLKKYGLQLQSKIKQNPKPNFNL